MPRPACAAARSPRAVRVPSPKDHATWSCPSSRQQVPTSFQQRVRRGKRREHAALQLRKLALDPRIRRVVTPEPRTHAVLDHLHDSLPKTLPPAYAQLSAALKIRKVPIDRPNEIGNPLPFHSDALEYGRCPRVSLARR